MFEEIPKNCRYGYARVSSKSQEDNFSLEVQKKEFIKQGVPKKNIRLEVDRVGLYTYQNIVQRLK